MALIRDPSIRRRIVAPVTGWCLWLLLTVALLAAWQYRARSLDFQQQSAALLRLASQRAGQHDAHLTALSAIASAQEDQGHGLFLEVAQTIIHFYPRIDEIWLVPFDPTAPVAGIGKPPPDLAGMVRAAALASTGQIVIEPYPDRPGQYLMIKRSPNTAAARYGLALAIDASKLLEDAGPFWSERGVAQSLFLPDGMALVRHGPDTGALHDTHVLASSSQPLRLTTRQALRIADLLPPWPTTLVLLIASLLYGAAWLGLRQYRRTRAAEERARISALDSRLAHASRVNNLGEMAGGLAHELTQPLTAVLALSQASVRLLDQGQTEKVPAILRDIIAQSKRASGLLERFRNWSRPRREAPEPIDLRETLRNVQSLLATQAVRLHIALTVSLPQEPASVLADPVEMEQVVFNLVRNAFEALDGMADRRVEVVLERNRQTCILDVSDNGPGVPPGLRDTIFAPFVTGRADGTGLGLALCQRLVERAGGEIFLAEAAGRLPGATFRVVLPSATQPVRRT